MRFGELVGVDCPAFLPANGESPRFGFVLDAQLGLAQAGAAGVEALDNSVEFRIPGTVKLHGL